MERVSILRRGLTGLLGAVMLSEAALLGVHTVKALDSEDRQPEGLVFERQMHELVHDQANTDPNSPVSNYELVNGFALNLIAVGGLAGAGTRLIRRAVRPGPTAAPAPTE